jgi:hypothetical protein
VTRGGLFCVGALGAFKGTMDRHWPGRVGGSRVRLGAADTFDHGLNYRPGTTARLAILRLARGHFSQAWMSPRA